MPGAWGKRGERRLTGGFEPDETDLKPCETVYAFS